MTLDAPVGAQPAVPEETRQAVSLQLLALLRRAVLAGSIDIAFDRLLRLEQADILQQQWGLGEGSVLKALAQTRRADIQRRPEYQKPPGLLDDLRVRQALMYGLDRDSLNQGLLNGQSRPENSLALPNDPFYTQVERLVVKYPFDPRQSEQLMNQADFTRGPDGIYTSPQYGRFNVELGTLGAGQNVRELQILGNLWKAQGFDMSQYVMPPSQDQDAAARNSFSGILSTSAGNIESFTVAQTGTSANRWQGQNYGGRPSSPEYGRLIDAYNTVLDPPTRSQAYAQAAQILTEDVATILLLYDLTVVAFRSALSGVKAPGTAYNNQEWRMK